MWMESLDSHDSVRRYRKLHLEPLNRMAAAVAFLAVVQYRRFFAAWIFSAGTLRLFLGLAFWIRPLSSSCQTQTSIPDVSDT
jgi:hypothetical protein